MNIPQLFHSFIVYNHCCTTQFDFTHSTLLRFTTMFPPSYLHQQYQYLFHSTNMAAVTTFLHTIYKSSPKQRSLKLNDDVVLLVSVSGFLAV